MSSTAATTPSATANANNKQSNTSTSIIDRTPSRRTRVARRFVFLAVPILIAALFYTKLVRKWQLEPHHYGADVSLYGMPALYAYVFDFEAGEGDPRLLGEP